MFRALWARASSWILKEISGPECGGWDGTLEGPLFLFHVCKCFSCMYVCVVSLEGTDSTGTGVTEGCGSPCGFWEMNLGLLQNKQMPLTSDLPLTTYLKKILFQIPCDLFCRWNWQEAVVKLTHKVYGITMKSHVSPKAKGNSWSILKARRSGRFYIFEPSSLLWNDKLTTVELGRI